MHIVYLRSPRTSLILYYGSLTPVRQNHLDASARGIKLLGDFRRAVCGLNEISNFEAIELQTLLLYVALLIKNGLLHTGFSNSFFELAYVLNPPLSTAEYLLNCERFIREFCMGFTILALFKQFVF